MKKKYNEKANVKQAGRLFKGVDFQVLGEAVTALMKTSSTAYGSDCLMCTTLAKSFLKRKGIDASIIIGESAWRLDGQNGGAVVSHSLKSNPDLVVAPKNEGLPYGAIHAWLSLNPVWFLDVTVGQLGKKMELLDIHDGSVTPTTWNPSFLLFKESDISSFNDVQQSYDAGVFYYEKSTPLFSSPETLVHRQDELMDESDVDTLATIYDAIKAGGKTKIYGLEGVHTIKSRFAN